MGQGGGSTAMSLEEMLWVPVSRVVAASFVVITWAVSARASGVIDVGQIEFDEHRETVGFRRRRQGGVAGQLLADRPAHVVRETR
jgi:hypothetical protein